MAAPMNADEEVIVGINVTPLVDIVLVLLVILMVTASYVAGLAIPMELPRAVTGEASSRLFEVSIDAAGGIFVGSERVDEAGLRARVRTARQRDAALVASISADERAAHGRVLHVIDVLRQEWVVKFALDVEGAAEVPAAAASVR
jgi:biopolymer transport protein ExbD